MHISKNGQNQTCAVSEFINERKFTMELKICCEFKHGHTSTEDDPHSE